MAKLDHLIKLREALLGNPIRLRFITRFSNCPRAHNESVAEHSFYTALYAYLVAVSLRANGMKLDLGAVAGKALMHDVDECFSGDFIRMFKHSTPKVKAAIDEACAGLMKGLCLDMTDSPRLRAELYGDWENAKKDLEGRVVSFADFLSVVSYIAQEVETGNTRMLVQVSELRKFYNSFLKLEYEFLESYLKQTDDIITWLETWRDQL